MNELIAQEGYWLTQRQLANEDERLFVKAVKGINATLVYWQEVSDEWKEQWEAEHPQPEPPEPENE